MKKYFFRRSDKILLESVVNRQAMYLFLYWRSIKENAQWFFNQEINLKGHIDWFEKYLGDGTDYLFLASDVDTGIPIGMSSIYGIINHPATSSFYHRTCEFGRLLLAHPDYRDKGYGKEIVKLTLDIAFNSLDRDCITLDILKSNLKAERIYQDLGFRVWGWDNTKYWMGLGKYG
jgi:RimJ/RimL family protein N-acetyltransferase